VHTPPTQLPLQQSFVNEQFCPSLRQHWFVLVLHDNPVQHGPTPLIPHTLNA